MNQGRIQLLFFYVCFNMTEVINREPKKNIEKVTLFIYMKYSSVPGKRSRLGSNLLITVKWFLPCDGELESVTFS